MYDKKQFGQFYTTNAKYIIKNLLSFFPKNSCIVDPFAGNFDLLNLLDKNDFDIEAYDIDPKNNFTIKQDTILYPLNYKNKYILSNPPYLARNKNKDKTIYDKFKVYDLYEAFLKTICDASGGILILPSNFFCAQKSRVRKLFFTNFEIAKLNIFEEKVFNDTSISVSSFFFKKRENNNNEINIEFFPSNKKFKEIIKKEFDYRIGTDFFEILNTENIVNIRRLLKNESEPDSKIFLRAIDTGKPNGRISLSIKDPYYGKSTDRAFATICFSKNFSLNKQKRICFKFNEILENLREKYNSLFLTNFRNSTKLGARKRISFREAYKLIQYVIKTERLIN